MAVIPSKEAINSGQNVTLRDAVEQYTRSEKNIKEIVCQKQLLGWNFQDLTYKVKALIYSTGYRNHVDVVSLLSIHGIAILFSFLEIQCGQYTYQRSFIVKY